MLLIRRSEISICNFRCISCVEAFVCRLSLGRCEGLERKLIRVLSSYDVVIDLIATFLHVTAIRVFLNLIVRSINPEWNQGSKLEQLEIEFNSPSPFSGFLSVEGCSVLVECTVHPSGCIHRSPLSNGSRRSCPVIIFFPLWCDAEESGCNLNSRCKWMSTVPTQTESW